MKAALQSEQVAVAEVADIAAERVSSPYVGLVPFSERDSAFFFGRVKESTSIAANLRAARLTLLYGPSGVGKSSVLRAGVVAPLRAIALDDLTERGAPDFAVVFFNSWASDPMDGLAESIRKAVQDCLEQKTIDSIPTTRSLAEIIRTWTERYGIELLIILDQFEEYFLYHAGESGVGTFAYEFPRAINDSTLRARFLISMRDDTLSRLDRFKASIPTLFDNRLQIEHLDLASAREAIVQPVKKYNELYSEAKPFKFDRDEFNLPEGESPYSEKFLVGQVLSQVQVGKVTIGVTGQGIVKRDEEADESQVKASRTAIEAPYLQLVMTRIWNDEETIKTHELKAATLEKLGRAQKIVEQHLDNVMERLTEAEQDTAAAVFYYLVTPSGTKIAHTVKNLAEYTKLPEEPIQRLLEKLLKVQVGKEEHRILRRVNQKLGENEISAYEVYHDALAPAILAWSAKHKHELEKKLEAERARKWMLVIISALVLIGLLAAFVASRRAEQAQLLAAERAKQQLQAERAQALAREKSLLEQQNYLRPYKEIILSLISLTSGSPERKEGAIKTLQQQVETDQLDPELVPLIKSVLEDVVKAQPQTQAGKDAAEVVNQIIRQSQDTRLSPRVYIQIQDEEQREKAIFFQQRLNTTQLSDIPNVRPKIIAPGIENVGTRRNVQVSELRYFHQTELERQIGEQIVKILNDAGLTTIQLKLIGGYEDNPDIRPNHFELWLSSDVR